MGAPLPPSSQFNAPATTQAQFRSATTQLVDGYLAGLLGTSGLASEARSLLGITATPQAYNNRGAWVSMTPYLINDLVTFSGVTYLAINSVTSSTNPATDTTNWQVLQGVTAAQLAGSGGGQGAQMVGYKNPIASAARTLYTQLNELEFSPADFNITGNGTDESIAFTAAVVAINGMPTTNNTVGVLRLPPAVTGTYFFQSVKLLANVCIRAASYRANSRCAQDVVCSPPTGASPGFMFFTDAIAQTNFCGVEGIYLKGRAAPRTSGSDNGYTAGFGGINAGPTYRSSFCSNLFTEHGEQGLVTANGAQTDIKNNLAFNCVFYRIRTGLIGAADLIETDSYIDGNEWGTSSQIEAAITNAQPYLCGVYYRGGGNNFCHANVGEVSEIGTYDNSFVSRFFGDRSELCYANGMISAGFGTQLFGPFFRNNSLATNAGYSDLKVINNSGIQRQVIAPVFDFDGVGNAVSINIEDTLTNGPGQATSYWINRAATTCSFASPNTIVNGIPESNGIQVWRGRNQVRNSVLSGAVVSGALPTNFSASGGITPTVVALGQDGGMSYVDLRFNGTASTSFFSVLFEALNTVVAASGQSWWTSLFVKKVGGTLANLGNFQLLLNEYNGFSLTGSTSTIYAVPTDSLQYDRISTSRLLSGAGTTRADCGFIWSCTNGAAIDVTLRFALPQLEQGGTLGYPIETSGTAAALT